MMIREADAKDFHSIIELLHQVLEVHAKIKPEFFISGTTKYREDDLLKITQNENKKIFVAVENGNVLGHAFIEIKNSPKTENTAEFNFIYIDDICVDENSRGKSVGKNLFLHVKKFAKQKGIHAITLNVWEGNDSAYAFYKKMGMKIRKTEMEIDF